jgi:hypothetical protein
MDSIDWNETWELVQAKMGDAITKAAGTCKAVWNTIRTVGPFVVAQSDQASQALARHNARLAMVEAGEDFLKQELANYAEASKELLSEYGEATPKKKLQIQKDLEYFDQRVRQINIGVLAIGYAQTNADDPGTAKSTAQEEISPHWMDKFNELARVRNEDWRENLLARALAAESVSPGSVSPRTLWFLGTLEESMFRAFATLLDLCTAFDKTLVIPSPDPFRDRPIPGSSDSQEATIGKLLFLLSETGVLANTVTTRLTVYKGTRVARYGSECYLIESPETDLEVQGVLLSGLGQSVASFCERKFNPLGKEIVETWLKSLGRTKHTITPAELIGPNQYRKIGSPYAWLNT